MLTGSKGGGELKTKILFIVFYPQKTKFESWPQNKQILSET